MTLEEARGLFEDEVCHSFSTTGIHDLIAETKGADAIAIRARLRVAAKLAHAAFLAPEQVAESWDALTHAWQGEPVGAAPIHAGHQESVSPEAGLWEAFFKVVENSRAGNLDALQITQRAAALGGRVGASFLARAVEAAKAYPGVAAIEARDPPARIQLATLAACPPGSLGHIFHDLIVDNEFDLEVLDRDAMGLAKLPAPLGYLNTRILQSHDLWHIVAGYETTALEEVALSAFQMAQFGHNYSSQFLAVTAAISALGTPAGWVVLMASVTSAWRHGRETPPLMLIDWESRWTETTEALRRSFGIRPYDRPFPADLIEQARGT